MTAEVLQPVRYVHYTSTVHWLYSSKLSSSSSSSQSE